MSFSILPLNRRRRQDDILGQSFVDGVGGKELSGKDSSGVIVQGKDKIEPSVSAQVSEIGCFIF